MNFSHRSRTSACRRHTSPTALPRHTCLHLPPPTRRSTVSITSLHANPRESLRKILIVFIIVLQFMFMIIIYYSYSFILCYRESDDSCNSCKFMPTGKPPVLLPPRRRSQGRARYKTAPYGRNHTLRTAHWDGRRDMYSSCAS